MADKVTSLKIDSDTWRKAKLLAVKRGVTLKSMIEGLLQAEIKADEVCEGLDRLSFSTELFKILEERRKSGRVPLLIGSKRSAVEIVREHRGE